MAEGKHLILLLVMIGAMVKFDIVKGCMPVQGKRSNDFSQEVKSLRTELEALKKNQRDSTAFVQLKSELSELKINMETLFAEETERKSKLTAVLRDEIIEGLDALRHEVDVKVDTTKNQMKATHEKLDGQYNEILDSLKEMDDLFKNVKHQLNEVVVSLLNLDNETKSNFSTVQHLVNDLVEVVNSDLKAKVEDIYYNIEVIQQSKEEADRILSDTQLIVDKIHQNTFNKGAAVTACLTLVIFMFILAICVYRLQQKIAKMSKQH